MRSRGGVGEGKAFRSRRGSARSLHVALLTYPRRQARRQLPVAKSPGVRRAHPPARLILRTSAHLMNTKVTLYMWWLFQRPLWVFLSACWKSLYSA